MNKQFLRFTLFLLMYLTLPLTATAQVVSIPDPNLRAAIENALGKAPGTTITATEMATLTRLEAKNANISDLTGLQAATNLTSLDLGPEKVANEWRNSNAVTDLSPLAGLTQLTSLHLPNNSISDISAVAGLTNLTWLNLWGNSVSNISAVAGLTNLKDLYLGDNNISDISPLAANTGLGSGDTVNVKSNPLSYLSIGTHIPTLQSRGVTVEFDDTTHLNIGEPRTVRIIYFLPNDRPYRADVEQRAKDHVRKSQIFFAEQMRAHGYGNKTFRVETDSEGEPMVRRVAGEYPNSHYFHYMQDKVLDEVRYTFDLNSNLYYIVLGTDGGFRRNDGQAGGGTGQRWGKVGGFVMVSDELDFGLTAHELGHAFGLRHDFRDGSYIMSYGPGKNQLSACHAEYLSMNPYFNPDVPLEMRRPPTTELISPHTYPAGAKSVPIRLKISDSDGLHQVILFAITSESHSAGRDFEVKACRSLVEKKETIVEFDYDGVIPSDDSTNLSNSLVHELFVQAVDMKGNMVIERGVRPSFTLLSDALQPLTKISGDNQTGLPNTPLPAAFVVQLRNVHDGAVRRNVVVTFTITAGDGMLSVTRTITNEYGKAETTLTLGSNIGTTTVEVSAEGITVTFNAVAGAPVDIPDPYLRAVIETALGKAKDDSIAPSEMATLIRLEAPNANISNLTGLEFATNLTRLVLWDNSISDISPVVRLTNLTELALGGNNISDISPTAGLTRLTSLHLPGNNMSDVSAVSGLTHLTYLNLAGTNITDLSFLSGLTNLTELLLQNNNISDLSPLVANTGLGSGDTVDVRQNRLSDQSLHTHIPALQSRGVTVEFDPPAPPAPFENVPFNINNIPEPVPPPPAVRDFFELDPFYQQWINVEGFPVLASANVSPYAVKETAWKIKQMIGHRTDILKALARNRIRFSIVGHNELTTDIPELRDLSPRFYQNVRLRGGAGGGSYRTAWAAEEHILGRWGYVTIHEMAHEIHGIVKQQIDRTFDNRLETVYNAAMDKGLWQGSGHAVNKDEYWAEGVNVWFHTHHSSPVKTRDALKAYDSSLALLIAEVLGDHDWRHTPPAVRTPLPHLQGFNSQSSPQLKFPPGVEEAYEELRDPAINERNEWVNLPPYNPSLITNLNESRTRGAHTETLFANTDLIGASGANDTWAHTEILFVNTIDAEVLLYWVHPDGTETLHYRSPPNTWAIDLSPCRVGDLLLAKDSTGRNLAVFQAVEKTGRALVAPALNLITPGLSKISGDDQSSVSGAVLANPFVIEVRDENLSVLEGISVTFAITAGDGTLSITHTTTDKKGRAESTFTLGPNLGGNTVSVSADGIEGVVIFNAVVESAIDIPDSNVRAAVKTALGKAEGDPITPSEMATLTRLEAQNTNISNLTGLEGATNLIELILDNNSISDISPVAGLTKLTELILWDNNISDISAVVRLTNLKTLGLGGNLITDISAVTGLTNLTFLHLPGNRIADMSLVAGLTQLTWLYLGGINITDLSFLSGLTNLETLGLEYNSISDLSPLVANTGLGEGDTIYVQGNPLSYQSIHTHIPALQSRGVTVEFDNQAHPALLKISGDNQNGMSSAPLSHPFIIEAQDANGSALTGISVTFAVTAGGGTLNTTITRTDRNGRAQSTLTLGPNLGINTVKVSATGIESTATFYAVSDTESPSMTADVNSDGSVNVLDLVVIASELGNAGTNLAVDVNGDGDVNVLDLILVAGMFDGAAAAPSAHPQIPETLTAVEVQGWLTDARTLEVRDSIMQRGFLVLEQLLVALTPKETELLHNYPNPFNPETWIPYRLAEDAFVTLTIYDLSGQVVRNLDVGHRIASAYENQSKAIYWNGRNNVGERVASGVYFYALTAGDFSATRKMLILK